eukprot:1353550-Amphidinium_carterae.1
MSTRGIPSGKCEVKQGTTNQNNSTTRKHLDNGQCALHGEPRERRSSRLSCRVVLHLDEGAIAMSLRLLQWVLALLQICRCAY